jgi:hypothetical protein
MPPGGVAVRHVDRLADARECAQQRGLAGAIIAPESDAIAFVDVEAHTVESFDDDFARPARAGLTARLST